jgi:hypothetical protein
MRRNPLKTAFVGLAGVIALIGCAGQVGQTKTATINIPKPGDSSQTWDVEINLGAASATIGSSGESLLQGAIEYNVDSLEPKVTTGERRVQVSQEFQGVLPVNSRNDWKLQFGRGVPLNLAVNTGASSGTWELGGLSLKRLAWVQGAADATLKFSEANPERLDSFTINGGAASLTVRGLANANIRTANITAGAGAVTLYFDGALSQDGEIILDGGVSVVTIYSGNNPIELTSEGGLSNVDNTGWDQSGDTYTTPEWTGSSPKITIRARLGVAALQLIAGK